MTLTLLEMTLSGGVMILLVLLLRAILLNRLPKTAFIVMWAVVLVRLLLPVSFASLIYSEEPVEAETIVVSETDPDVFYTVEEATEASPNITTTKESYTFDDIVAIAESSKQASVFRIIWLVGAIICAATLATLYILNIRRFNKSENLETDFISSFQSSNKLRRTVTVKLSDKTTTPLTYGIIHPVILLPKGMDLSDQKQLKYILMHEYIHIRKLDNLLKGISSAAVCIHWFNPLVWVMNRFLSRDIELRCDETLLRQCDTDCRADYALTLINLEDKRRGYALGTAFAKEPSEERITAIMKFRPASVCSIAIAVALIIVIAALTFAGNFGSKTPSDEITNAEIVSLLDNFFEWNGYLAFINPELDYSDSIVVDGENYYRVIDEDLDTWDEWVDLTASIFCGELATYCTHEYDDFSYYLNIDGAVYACLAPGTYPYTDEYTYEILKNADGSALIRIDNPSLTGENPYHNVFTFSLTDQGWRIGKD
ncbi:MAG: M56 family metallopeptidase [Oscillospiraceae bacterium]|nr:M56 family metallopeptidase [Oscillospiraceae bacterium]